jgi:hypothetical protein
VAFDVSADCYLQFMGRFSEPLATVFADLAAVRPGQRVLDVGCGPGALTAGLFTQAGLARPRAGTISVTSRYASFADWWEPFTLGVGPAGDYVASLTPPRQAALREHCQRQLPAGPIEVQATAWAVVGQA